MIIIKLVLVKKNNKKVVLELKTSRHFSIKNQLLKSKQLTQIKNKLSNLIIPLILLKKCNTLNLII